MMVQLPTFDVTASQRQRIVTALRRITQADPSASESDVFKQWLRNALIDAVKQSEESLIGEDYVRNLEAQYAQIRGDLGGMT